MVKSRRASESASPRIVDRESPSGTAADADFFMASSDSPSLGTHACWHVRRAASTTRDDLLIVRVFPPLSVPDHDESLHDVVLAPRHQGHGLFPIREWPVDVHVIVVPMHALATGSTLDGSSLRSMYWAELYRYARDVPAVGFTPPRG